MSQKKSRSRELGNTPAEFIQANDLVVPRPFFGSGYGRDEPDASFEDSKANYPGIVIKVSQSQKRKNLPCLADEYILGLYGNISFVIGLDIEYSGKMATVSVAAMVTDQLRRKRIASGENFSNQV